MAPETKLVEFRKSHPIDFSLLDHDDQAVMYISEDKEDWALHLAIANTSSQPITLADVQGAASATNHHFALRFRPGTLSKRTLGLLTTEEFKNVVATPWALAKLGQPAPDAVVTLYLLHTGQKTLAPNEKLSVELSGISAAPGSGSRGTQVELIPNHKQVKFADQTEVTGSRTQYLHVTNHSGRKNIPLHVAIVEGNRVLNGETVEKLTLRITNVLQSKDLSKPSTIMLRGSGETKTKTKLVLSYDAGEDAWALTKKGVAAAKVTPPANTSVVPFTQGDAPECVITFNQDLTLESRKSFDITIEKLAVSEKPGNANLYLRYENIPGYWDGQFVCTVEKGPIVVKDGNVGIGTPPAPKVRLDVNGAANIWSGTRVAAAEGHMPPGSLTIGSTNANFGGGRGWNNNTAALLLETLDNTEIAVHDSGQRLASLMYYEGDAVNRITIGREMDPAWKAISTLALNGNVGIGTPTPKNALDIKGSLVIGSKYAGVKKIPDNGLQVEGDVIFDHDLTVGHDLTVENGTVKSKSLAATSQITGGSLTVGDPTPETKAMAIAVKGKNYLSFGEGLDKGNGANGHIGYQAYSDGLDIVGAGTGPGYDNRKITLWAEGGLKVNLGGRYETMGWMTVTGNVHLMNDLFVHGRICNIKNDKWQNLEARWYNNWQYALYEDVPTTDWFRKPAVSDLRLKSDIRCVPSALERVRHLRGVTYRWNEDALRYFTQDIETTISAGPDATEQENQEVWKAEREKRRNQLAVTEVGVVAQDVEAVFPEAVTTGADGYKAVRYDDLIPLLIEAIKEQDRLAARQQTEIEQLKQALLTAAAPRQH